MGDARHNVGNDRMAPDLEKRALVLVAEVGWKRAADRLGTTENTLGKLLQGPGLTKRNRDRIEAKAREIFHVEIAAQAGTIESADGVTRGSFVSVQISGSAEAAGQAFGAALALAKRAGAFGS